METNVILVGVQTFGNECTYLCMCVMTVGSGVIRGLGPRLPNCQLVPLAQKIPPVIKSVGNSKSVQIRQKGLPAFRRTCQKFSVYFIRKSADKPSHGTHSRVKRMQHPAFFTCIHGKYSADIWDPSTPSSEVHLHHCCRADLYMLHLKLSVQQLY
jgi:hypothetical protein